VASGDVIVQTTDGLTVANVLQGVNWANSPAIVRLQGVTTTPDGGSIVIGTDINSGAYGLIVGGSPLASDLFDGSKKYDITITEH
jgi:hypothetical protein